VDSFDLCFWTPDLLGLVIMIYVHLQPWLVLPNYLRKVNSKFNKIIESSLNHLTWIDSAMYSAVDEMRTVPVDAMVG
jgi:hypothetical protein